MALYSSKKFLSVVTRKNKFIKSLFNPRLTQINSAGINRDFTNIRKLVMT